MGGVLLPLLALSACSGGGDEEDAPTGTPVAPVPVELAVDEAVGEPIRLGVVVSLASPPGQGADYLPGAAGARVAQFRLGSEDVELQVVDDGGTHEGARRAIGELVDSGVAGIVAATDGSHLLPGLQDASAADVPVLLPYLQTAEPLPEGVWTTGPALSSTVTRINDYLAARDLDSPVVLAGDRVSVDGIGTGERIGLRAGQVDPAITALQELVREDQVDSVVVAASALTQARVVSRLQGVLPDLPVVLTADALSPRFTDGLGEAGGTPDGRFVTVGADAADTTTLGRSEQASAAAAYFGALRLAATDPDVQDLFGAAPFSEVADGADTASHDAVVSLVRAVEEAGSTDPGAVREALPSLDLGAGDGLAGPPLRFAAPQTVDGAAVVVLRATTQDPGVRPLTDGTELFWFALPDA